ncbi:hypothetical protein ONZ45_g9914 [Pleurotus djamor]|nr:hypothetical protein ONZ45_g9914 [Pleurotus djamor]
MPRPSTAPPISAQQQQEQVSEGIENFELPKTLVTKIAKSALPENAKLQKDVVLALVKSSTVFINYLAATSHDIAQSKQHKSISASDVLKALEAIEFGDIVEGLQTELQSAFSSHSLLMTRRLTFCIDFRTVSKNDKGKKPVASKTKASTSTSGASGQAQPAPISITLPASKGKGKAKGTTANAPGVSNAPTDADKMDVDADAPSTVLAPADMDEDIQAEGVEDEDQDMADEEDDEVEEEPEELVDTVALEEEELKKDAKGVDDDP